jgi:hypothetical protein
MQLHWELFIGNKYIGEPDWSQVREALEQLNGDDINMILIEAPDKGALVAGGGNHGRYAVIYSPDDLSDTPSLTLTDLSKTGPDVELVVQTVATYPAKWCVELPLALKVFDFFFHTGSLPKDVRWELANSEEEATKDDIP